MISFTKPIGCRQRRDSLCVWSVRPLNQRSETTCPEDAVKPPQDRKRRLCDVIRSNAADGIGSPGLNQPKRQTRDQGTSTIDAGQYAERQEQVTRPALWLLLSALAIMPIKWENPDNLPIPAPALSGFFRIRNTQNMKNRLTLRALTVIALCLMIEPTMGLAHAGQWYEPDNAGHGLSWDAVGSGYQAQWYFHDGSTTRWVVTDVCDFGEPCALFTVDAYAFPAHGAKSVDAGEIIIDRIGADALVTYDIHIPEIGCWSLPGPLPPVCRDAAGVSDVSLIYRRGVSEAGMMLMEALVE